MPSSRRGRVLMALLDVPLLLSAIVWPAQPTATTRLALPSRAVQPALVARTGDAGSSSTPCEKVVGLVGLPDDRNSSFMSGPHLAPPLIREAIASDSANPYAESGLAAASAFLDLGDLPPTVSHEQIGESVKGVLDRGLRPLYLGGDHAISYPIIRGVVAWRRDRARDVLRSNFDPSFSVLHFDAHTDTYDSLYGNEFSHACPFARTLELEHAPGLVQVGIRTMTPAQREFAAHHGIAMLTPGNWPESRKDLRTFLEEQLPPARQAPFVHNVYISVDMDALDPAFAPGVSHHEPGGLSTRQLLDVLAALPPWTRVIGADCVEYNPTRDLNGVTAMVAAKVRNQ